MQTRQSPSPAEPGSEGTPVPALRIIPRAEHGISRRQISPAALKVLYRLAEAGHAAYLVGGAVRDLLLGGSPKDFDVATDATPEQVQALFRNCRLIGRRFRLAHVLFGPEIIEVATFRAIHADPDDDREVIDGRVVRDNVWGSQEEDALRRDFTVNALYYGITDFAVRDYVGGYQDIAARRLRLIGDPETRYREDPVRMLRAVRLAAKLGFTIDPPTEAPIAAMKGLLREVPSARLFDECLKLFLSGHAVESFLGLERRGLFPVLFPAAAAALAADEEGKDRALILRALNNTDARVREDKPVTPAFLFAALLWPAYRREVEAQLAAGLDPQRSHQEAADAVILAQTRIVALPRRFAGPLVEIWGMQWRFERRQRRRVVALLQHPRFRAGFDFLALRREESPQLAELVAWWEAAQQAGDRELADLLAAAADGGGGKKTRRRRRRGRRKRNAGSAAEG